VLAYSRIAGARAEGSTGPIPLAAFSQILGRDIAANDMIPAIDNLVAANLIARKGHGHFEVTDPFVQHVWLLHAQMRQRLGGTMPEATVPAAPHTRQQTPMKPPPGLASSNDEVQALLLRHRCPTPLYALRALLLGHIASPRLQVSPIAALAQAWGGELPEFATAAEAEDLMRVIAQGLWNRLSEHLSTRHPFRLLRQEVKPTRQALLDLARTRAQELKSFVDGLFGAEEEMLLPQKAHDAMEVLAELHTMFNGAELLLADPAKAASDEALEQLLRNLQKLTISADEAINKVVQSCKRAREQRLETMATVMSRKIATTDDDELDEDEMTAHEDEQDFIDSPLSQRVTRNGVTVQVEIYGDSKGLWILEVVDAENNSHLWDEHFETDQQALDAALRALDEEPLDFTGRSDERPLN
jgi:hypothetical protein